MEEEYTSRLLGAASDFVHYPGAQNDAAEKEFLDRFPLPAIISALQTGADVPGLESTLVNYLERVFETKYGASLIPHFMAASQEVHVVTGAPDFVFTSEVQSPRLFIRKDSSGGIN